MNMKKTDFNRYNAFTANVADGLERGEAQRMQESASKMYKAEKAKAWLKAQEAEFLTLTAKISDDLLSSLKKWEVIYNSAKASKLNTKADLHQVFVLPHEDYAMAA